MKGFLAAGLLACLLLSGCTSSPTAPSSTSHAATTAATSSSASSHPTTAASTTTTSSTTAPANVPPTATLTASNATGSIPFNVTFHATGSDADGDSLTYSLSFGDGTAASTGTALPADIVHQYSVVGNFTAKLTVGDGKSEVNTTALVAATAAAAAGGPQVVTGSWISGGPIACEQFLDGDDLHQMADQTGDFDWVQFDVRADTIDKAFKATLEPVGAPGGGFEIDFYDAGGSNLGYFDSAPPDGLTIEGTVPASAAIGILFVCTPGPGDFTYTAG